MDNHDFSLDLSRKDGFEFSVQFDDAGLPTVLMDEPEPLGHGRGPNAARLLGAAVGHCLSASLLFCLQKSRIEVAGLETRVSGSILRNEEGRFRIANVRVKLAPRVAADAHQRMERCLGIFEDFCIVTESVRRGIDVAVEVEPSDVTA